MEQSEASNHTRKTQRGPSNHPARYDLAYDAPVTTRRVSKAAPPHEFLANSVTKSQPDASARDHTESRPIPYDAARLINPKTSARDFGSVLKAPRMALVRHKLPGLRMPRIVMQL